MATDTELEKLQREDHDRLVRLEGKIDTFIAMQGDAKSELADHEVRLRSIEKDSSDFKGKMTGVRWVMAGTIAVVGVLEPVILFFLSKGN